MTWLGVGIWPSPETCAEVMIVRVRARVRVMVTAQSSVRVRVGLRVRFWVRVKQGWEARRTCAEFMIIASFSSGIVQQRTAIACGAPHGTWYGGHARS